MNATGHRRLRLSPLQRSINSLAGADAHDLSYALHCTVADIHRTRLRLGRDPRDGLPAQDKPCRNPT